MLSCTLYIKIRNTPYTAQNNYKTPEMVNQLSNNPNKFTAGVASTNVFVTSASTVTNPVVSQIEVIENSPVITEVSLLEKNINFLN